jgi:hypothetical protein
VVANYLEYLNNGIASANTVASKALLALLAKSGTTTARLNLNDLLQVDLLNNLNNGDVVPVIVFNSLAWDRTGTIKTIINKQTVTVQRNFEFKFSLNKIDFSGAKVNSQVIPLGNDKYELSFTTGATVPAMGYTVYFINVAKDQETMTKKPKLVQNDVISNSIYDLTYENGKLNKIKNKRDNFEISFERQVLTYDSYTGPGQASGAYIFRSTGPSATPVSITSQPKHVEGSVSHVISQDLGDFVKETVRLYKSTDKDATSAYGEANIIDFEFAVGVLPGNKEAVVRFNTNIKNNLEILTDSNGLQSYRRMYRDWPNDPKKNLFPTASNFYPLVYHATIGDDQYQLSIITNSSRGVASLKDGSIEVMVHRRCLVDDGRGVSDPMNDINIVGVNLRIIIEKKVRNFEN